MIIYLENQKYGFKIKKNNTECAFPHLQFKPIRERKNVEILNLKGTKRSDSSRRLFPPLEDSW